VRAPKAEKVRVAKVEKVRAPKVEKVRAPEVAKVRAPKAEKLPESSEAAEVPAVALPDAARPARPERAQ
jgi:hypothetical protein